MVWVRRGSSYNDYSGFQKLFSICIFFAFFRWNDIITNNRNLLKNFDLTILYKKLAKKSEDLIFKDFNSVKYQNLFVERLIAFPNETIDKASKFLDDIQKITLKHTNESVCDEILVKFPKVKSLILAASTPSPSKVNLPNLEELQVFLSTSALKIFTCENLKQLSVLDYSYHRTCDTMIPNTRDEFSRVLNNFLLTCEFLKELTIGNVYYKFYDLIEAENEVDPTKSSRFKMNTKPSQLQSTTESTQPSSSRLQSLRSIDFGLRIDDIKFNLEKLSLQGVIIEDEELLKLLKHQKNSLKSIELILFEDVKIRKSMHFMLTKMSIESLAIDVNNSFELEGFEWQPNETIKNLVIYKIEHSEGYEEFGEYGFWFENLLSICKGVESLEIKFDLFDGILKSAAQLPALKKLKLKELFSESDPMKFEKLKHLEIHEFFSDSEDFNYIYLG